MGTGHNHIVLYGGWPLQKDQQYGRTRTVCHLGSADLEAEINYRSELLIKQSIMTAWWSPSKSSEPGAQAGIPGCQKRCSVSHANTRKLMCSDFMGEDSGNFESATFHGLSPHASLPLTDFNLHPFPVINHNPDTTACGAFRESFQYVIKPEGVLGNQLRPTSVGDTGEASLGERVFQHAVVPYVSLVPHWITATYSASRQHRPLTAAVMACGHPGSTWPLWAPVPSVKGGFE